MQAEAREAGFADAGIALTAKRMGEPFKAPLVLMSSGENVVTVGKETGVGGRNQEYCIAAAMYISGEKGVVFGAVDTVTDGYTLSEAEEKGVNLELALKTHGTSAPLWQLGCGVSAESCISALDLRIIYIGE